MLCFQSDVVDWWLVVMLPLLRITGWCFAMWWCYYHFLSSLADVIAILPKVWLMLLPLLLYLACCCWRHCCANGRCYCHCVFCLADVIANGWCYCQVADVIATFEHYVRWLMLLPGGWCYCHIATLLPQQCLQQQHAKYNNSGNNISHTFSNMAITSAKLDKKW